MAKLPDFDEWARELGKKGAQYALELLEQECGVSAVRLRELAQADREGRVEIIEPDVYECIKVVRKAQAALRREQDGE